jgi:YVTN family beta-propeller protein
MLPVVALGVVAALTPSSFVKVLESNITVATYPLDIALAPDNKTVFISHHTPGAISEIRANKVVRSATVAAGLTGLSLSKDGTRLYVGIGEGAVGVVDTKTLALVEQHKVNAFPIGVRLSPDERYVAAVCNQANTLDLIVLGTKQHVSVPVSAFPYWLAISPDGKRVFVSSYSANELSVVDVAFDKEGKLQAKAGTPIKVGLNPVGVAISPDGREVYTANFGDKTVSVVDTRKLKTVRTYEVGNQPYYVAVDPKQEFIIVSNYGSPHFDIIGADGKRSVVKASESMVNIYMSPDGKRIYTTNFMNARLGIIE